MTDTGMPRPGTHVPGAGLELAASRASLVALGMLALVAAGGAPAARALVGPEAVVTLWAEGARGTLAAAALVLVVAFTVGTFAGSVAALGPSTADALLSRTMEIAGALPSLVVAVVIRELHPMPDYLVFASVLAVLHGLVTAKVVRARLHQLLGEDFVMATRAVGASPGRLLRRHLLPHVAGVALSGAIFSASAVVALDAALSFVGLGTSGSSWGGTIAEATRSSAPWLAAAPTAGVLVTTLALWGVSSAVSRRWAVGRIFV